MLNSRGASQRAAQLLIRAAPKSALAVARAIVAEASSPGRQLTAVPFSVGDARFTLARGTDRAAWVDYERLAEQGLPYEPFMLACLTRLLQQSPASRFMDVGAHLGYYACYVSSLPGGNHEVYAVESNPGYCAALRTSARINRFLRVKVFEAALSDRVESVDVDGPMVRHDRGRLGSRTTTVTLDDLCEREGLRPTIVKMDVHGAEGKVVLGMPRTLAQVDAVLLEMHDLPLLRASSPGVRRSAMLDALEDAGLTLYYVAGHSASTRFMPSFDDLLAGRGYTYRKLDRDSRDLMLFDRSHDEFVLALRRNVEQVLGPSVTADND